ncbi:MAG TPA: TonB-dependent receptor [Bacteroidota bacterium]|nr:TonB-dependent receptor [Bacteroidota bacterium]
MKRPALLVAALLVLIMPARGQDSSAVRDSSGALPRLEIPEITIVGKKAIILPFARKGEVYDAETYEAPPPDTSLLGERRMMAFPIGALPRYEEELAPWRAAIEGGLGNYTSGQAAGYLGYSALSWGIDGHLGFQTTQGYTANASGNSFQTGIAAHSLVATDNDLMRNFSTEGSIDFVKDSYGMFGLPPGTVRRTRSSFGLSGSIGSADREGSVFDLRLGARVTGISDQLPVRDSAVTVVSPSIEASFSGDAGATRIVTALVYRNSSLDYSRTTESPSLFGLSAGARWRLSGGLLVTLGGLVRHGTGTDGNDHTMVAPEATVTWEHARDQVWSFWFRPDFSLDPYDELSERDPYLVREIQMRPQRDPVRIGSTLEYNSTGLTFELEGFYTHGYDHAVELADSGRISYAFADVDAVTIRGNGALFLADGLVLHFRGTISPERASGTSVQLPMVPLVEAGGRLEGTLPMPMTLWGGLTYTSKRNVDPAGARTLGDAVLVDAGCSTSRIPRTALSLSIRNIFNTAYEWWEGYSAPGRKIMLEAKVNLE